MSPRPSAKTNGLSPEFAEEEVIIRGVPYRFRELSIGDYDDIVKKATTTKTNPLTGEEREETDNAVLLRLMVMKSAIEPRLTPEALSSLPMRVALKVNQTVNRMHYGDEPESEKKEDDSDAGEEEPKGNDSPPAT